LSANIQYIRTLSNHARSLLQYRINTGSAAFFIKRIGRGIDDTHDGRPLQGQQAAFAIERQNWRLIVTFEHDSAKYKGILHATRTNTIIQESTQTDNMKFLLAIARIITGVLFIFSGLVKANDPIGLSYKMQEFFEKWNMEWLNNGALLLSVLMIAFEIIAGIAVLIGWRMRLFSWLLLLLILFFTFLTGYAHLSGKFKSCGCFGDCIPLKPLQSFIKDLILLALILLIFFYRSKIQPLLKSKPGITVMLLGVLLAFGLQWYTLNYLPVKDCLAYRVGNNIPEQMKLPQGAAISQSIIKFIYKKEGKEVEIISGQWPADFNDSVYTFVRRIEEKPVDAATVLPPITGFAMNTVSGNDTLSYMMSQPDVFVFVVSKLDAMNGRWNRELAKIAKEAKAKNIPFGILTMEAAAAEKIVNGDNKYGVPIYTCDEKAIKTAARTAAVLYRIRQGTVTGKWSYRSLGGVKI
jgi:uncharacterized membrane protein YphA (DoxX/SURF4 family)